MNLEEIKSIITREAHAVSNIPVTEQYNKAVDLIVEHVHKKKGKLVISGMGKAGQIGQNIATTVVLPAHRPFLHPSEAQHGDSYSSRQRPASFDYHLKTRETSNSSISPEACMTYSLS